MKKFFVGIVAMACSQVYSQKIESGIVTYYKDIEGIILKNCAPCHQPGKAGPFSLLTYKDVASRGAFIAHVTKSKYMPPWKADPSYSSFANERTLTDSDIELIAKWVNLGMPKGKKKKENTKVPAGPYPAQMPDMTLTMNEAYPIQATGTDDYRFFVLPTNLPADKYLSAIEFVPGNKRLVHHSRLMTDTTHQVRAIHGLSADDPAISSFEKYPPADPFLYGWVPGNFPLLFPEGTGKKIHRQSDIILNIHYAPTGAVSFDQSKVNLYFTDRPIEREVYSLSITESHITNPPFLIKAFTKPTFYSTYGPLPASISVIAVLPHMHYLGKYFKAYALTPEGETIPLIRINDWDFRWQGNYQYSKLLYIPKGSTIHIEAKFDNTEENKDNPNNPPIDVTYGWNTTKEMLDMVIYFLLYKTGDEDLPAFRKG